MGSVEPEMSVFLANPRKELNRMTCRSVICIYATLGASAAGAGPLSVSASVGALPSFSPYDLVTFDGAIPADVSLTFSGDAGIVSGSEPGVRAAPFFSGGQGQALESTADGLDLTPYLATGTGSATMTFATPQREVFWVQGSADAQNIALFSGTTLIGTVTGTDIAGSPTGDQGPAGTFGVNISSAVPFTGIEWSGPQFITNEFDDVAVASASVPEPGSLVVLICGILGMGAIGSASSLRRART